MGLVQKIREAANRNFAFVLAGLFSISSFACPCPACYFAAAGSFVGGIAQKLGLVK